MIYFNNRNGSSGLTRRLILPQTDLRYLPYMADGTAHYAEKVGDTQQLSLSQNVPNFSSSS